MAPVTGKTSLNPVGGPGAGAVLRNAVPPLPPPPRPLAMPLGPMATADFDQELTAARAMAPGDARRVSRLTALAYWLLTSPPRCVRSRLVVRDAHREWFDTLTKR